MENYSWGENAEILSPSNLTNGFGIPILVADRLLNYATYCEMAPATGPFFFMAIPQTHDSPKAADIVRIVIYP
jgi:hypothetical protein